MFEAVAAHFRVKLQAQHVLPASESLLAAQRGRGEQGAALRQVEGVAVPLEDRVLGSAGQARCQPTQPPPRRGTTRPVRMNPLS